MANCRSPSNGRPTAKTQVLANQAAVMENASKERIKIAGTYKNDLFCLLCLTVFVIAIFSSTIFSGKDISRIGTVAHRDTLFGRLAKGTPDPMDTCTYQEHAPNYLLTERIIAGGDLPLWNPYLGFGCPLWADSQVLAFSPITWLQAPFASMRLYNLLMVVHIWLGCLFAYSFARLLKLSPPASLLASMSYGLCPNLLYMFEWNRCQSAFFPLPFFGFALLWRYSTSLSIVVCALSCTAMVVSGHAVPSFFAIFLASVMYFSLSLGEPQTQAGSGFVRLPRIACNFISVGIITLLLSAPFVVPFLEGVRASDTFKATQGYVRYIVRASALLPSLFYPFHGAGSVYAGAISIILAVSAPFVSRRNRRLVLLLSGVALFIICILTRPGPFDIVFQLPYLNWFMVLYALPALLLFIAVLAGAGFDALLEEDSRLRSAAIIFAVALLAIAMPTIFQNMHLTAKFTLLNDWVKTMEVSSAVRIRELIIIVIFLSVVFSLSKCPANLRSKLILCLIVLNAVSLSFTIRKSLPARPAFAYEAVEPLGFLRSQGRRVISMGRHVLVPNTSQIFSVSNVLSFMPTHPKGVPSFLEAMGITLEGVSQFAEKPLTRLVDIGAVKYAVASEPVLSAEDKLPEAVGVSVNGGISFSSHVNLVGYGLQLDASNQDIVGRLKWKLSSVREKSSAVFMVMLLKPDGSVLWIGDRHSIDEAKESYVTASIPKSVKPGDEVCLIMQVLDLSSMKLLSASNAPASMQFLPSPNSLLLGRFKVPEKAPSTNRQFRLVHETAPEMVRVYENKSCLPEAYMVTATHTVGSIEEALSQMLKPGFDPKTVAVVEGSDIRSSGLKPGEANTSGATLIEAKVSRSGVNEVLVEAEPKQPSLLVLTDVCFPGWRVTIDGRDAPIIRANGVFRGVFLEAGHHKLRFFFDPISVKIGFAMFFLGLIFVLFLLRPLRSFTKKPLDSGPEPS
jgi:hypothetical protein